MRQEQLELQSKTAIVTGTSSGLGLAVAGLLLERGFVVYGASRSESPIDHPNFIEFELDVTQELSIKGFFEAVKTEVEVIDVLVNAAGLCELGALSETTGLDLRMHFETNVIGTFNFLKYFEPFIIADETHIFNLLSISAKQYYENTTAYTSSEFAKKGMLGIFEKEWKKYQIRLTNFYMGAINTPTWDDYPEIETDQMLSIDDFLYVFNSVLEAPESIQFPDITFMHKAGFLS